MIRSSRGWWWPIAIALAVCTVAAAAPTITMELGAGRMDRTEVRATVIQEDERPMTRQTVAFYLVPDFFPNQGKRLHGTHPVLLGTDTTDTTGTASQSFEPPFTGEATFEARVLDDNGRTIASHSLLAAIERTDSPAPPTVSQPLEAVRTPFGFAIIGLVAGLWLFFGVLTVGTIASIRRAGRLAISSTGSAE